MISKSLLSLVHSLQQKKFRLREGLFVAEGPKVVGDMMGRYSLHTVIATSEWLSLHRSSLPDCPVFEVSPDELRRASLLQHPQQVIALMRLPDSGTSVPKASALSIVLDAVQDPGNMGTIIRLADWFGIDSIYCSPSTADAYNPKVVQAAMGSLGRVAIVYTDLLSMLRSVGSELPVYGLTLDGDNIYSAQLTGNGLIVMGNEGNGISPSVSDMLSRRLLIPSFHSTSTTGSAESLNVAVATAIACSEFRRRFPVWDVWAK